MSPAGATPERDALAALRAELGADAAGWFPAERTGRGCVWSAGGGDDPSKVEPALPRPLLARLAGTSAVLLGREELARFPLAVARGLGWLALAGTRAGLLYAEGGARPAPRVDRVERAARRLVGEGPARQPAAAVAHDLRHQLALAALECRRLAEAGPWDGAELAGIERALGTAEDLCGDLLGTSRASACRAVELRPLLERELEAALRIARRSSDVRVVLRCPRRLAAAIDAAALGRCVRNLVLNAIEASVAGGSVRVEARATSPEDTLEVRVRDRGRGMRPEELERSMRAGATGGGGTGHGTTSVLACAERLGARLAIESRPGWGTRALLSVPSACCSERAAVVHVGPRVSADDPDDAGGAERVPADSLAAFERILARRPVRSVLAARGLAASERARLAARCAAESIPYAESSCAAAAPPVGDSRHASVADGRAAGTASPSR